MARPKAKAKPKAAGKVKAVPAKPKPKEAPVGRSYLMALIMN